MEAQADFTAEETSNKTSLKRIINIKNIPAFDIVQMRE